MSEKFQNLSDDVKLKLKKAYKQFSAIEEEVRGFKDQQKDVISSVEKEIDKVVNKKDIKKIFNFLKKQTTPEELRDTANLIEEIEE
jgi:hypothetical protein